MAVPYNELLDMFRAKNKYMNDNVLSEDDKEELYDLLDALANDLYSNMNYESIYDSCKQFIISIFNKYCYLPNTKTEDAPSAIRRMPFLIKFMLYYMLYRSYELYENVVDKEYCEKPSQKKLIDYIGEINIEYIDGNNKRAIKNFKISDKTFTYFGVSPNVLVDAYNYKQINLPNTYPGAKVYELGYIINYLVSFADTYDNFVDVFGGGAFATLAVNQSDTVTYYINEYDKFNHCYYNVLKDDELYAEFRKRFEKIQKEYIETDYDETIGAKYYSDYEKVEREFRALSDKENDFSIIVSKVDVVDCALAFVYLKSFTLNGGSSDKSQVKKSAMIKFANLGYLDEFDKAHKKLSRVKDCFIEDALSDGVYDKFDTLSPAIYSSYEKEINLVRSYCKQNPKCEKSQVNKYIGQVAEKWLEGQQSKEKGDINKCIWTIKRLGLPPREYKTLYYVDSPYLCTKGYKGGGITEEQMCWLVDKLLKKSSQGNSFIFSCRAVVSKQYESLYTMSQCFGMGSLRNYPRDEYGNVLLPDMAEDYYDYEADKKYSASKAVKTALDVLQANDMIFKNIFKKFLDSKEDKQIYVLACINQQSKSQNITFSDVLAVCGICEIFITDINFSLPNNYVFESRGKDSIDKNSRYTKFEKYTIKEFCDLLNKESFKSAIKYAKKKIDDEHYEVIRISK